MNAQEYAAFESKCAAELEAKQERIAEILLQFSRKIDIHQGRIEFLAGEELYLAATVIPVGSWGSQSQSWLWAWANPSLDANMRAKSQRLQELQATTGNPAFLSKEGIPAAEADAWRFAAVACRQLGGIGALMEPVDQTEWFFVILELAHVK